MRFFSVVDRRCVLCSRIISQDSKANKHQILQGDREFEALSEAILAFRIALVYSAGKNSELISMVDFE